MNPLLENVDGYLKKYSFGNWILESNVQNKINNAVVIPVISEYENLRKLLSSLINNDGTYFSQTVIIIVVNNFFDSSEEIRLDNQMSLNFLRTIISKNNFEDSLATEITNSNLNICLIDASSKGFEMPNKIGGANTIAPRPH